MSMSVNRVSEIDSLIAELADDHGSARQGARESLVMIGKPAVAPLIAALQHPNWRIRWGAAKALGQIGDPAAADALVKMLEDERSGVRWLAAEGLIALECDGLATLLEALIHHSDSEWLREGAHHVIHSLTEQVPDLCHLLAPVSAALGDIEPVLEVPPAARTALDALARGKKNSHTLERV
jgi:HEAT repeat protein